MSLPAAVLPDRSMALSVFEGLELAGQLRSQVEGSGTNDKALGIQHPVGRTASHAAGLGDFPILDREIADIMVVVKR